MGPNLNATFGSFFFRNEGNGLYYSEYLERSSNIVSQEISRLAGNSRNEDPFRGRFNTSWIEPSNDLFTAILNIRRNGNAYLLRWTTIRRNGQIVNYRYEGSAFRKGDELVGSYWWVRV